MVKIAIDAGHGMNTSGKRTPDGEREWSFNNMVVLAAIERLKQYSGVEILRLDDPTGKTDVSLRNRTIKANAWGADVLVSVHHNALAGKWGNHGGVETFVHPTGSRSSYAIADAIQPRIVATMGLRNRGIKQKNLQVLRESNMPAILTEGGFMDSMTDIAALRSESKLKMQGESIADGLAVYFKLKTDAKTNVQFNPSTSASVSTHGQKRGSATVIVPTLSLRSTPNINSKIIRELKKNESYTVYGEVDGWLDLGNSQWASWQNGKYMNWSEKPNVNTKPSTPVAAKPTVKGVLKYGDSGNEVRVMQEALAKAHFYPEKKAKNNGIDGQFGAKTLDALKRFQSIHTPNEIDGIYGSRTRAVLERVNSKK